jgi:hypothetical protein
MVPTKESPYRSGLAGGWWLGAGVASVPPDSVSRNGNPQTFTQ